MTTTKGPTMPSTPEVLRHLATLLDGLPGIPEPLVIVQPNGAVTVSFHTDAGPEAARDNAVEMLLVVVDGTWAKTSRNGNVYGGTARFHDRVLYVESHRARVGAVA